MIKGFKLSENLISFEKEFKTWEEAIKASSIELVKQGFMTEGYVQAMVDSVNEFGPYIVIAPNIAMPHARPEKGAKKVGFSVTVTEEPVKFKEDPMYHARLLVTLSCVDSNTHLEMMQALVEVLGEEENVEKILSTKNKTDIIKLFNKETT